MELVQTTQIQKQANTGGVAKFIKMKTGAKVLLRVNVDIQGCLFNGQTGSIIHIEFVLGRKNLF